MTAAAAMSSPRPRHIRTAQEIAILSSWTDIRGHTAACLPLLQTSPGCVSWTPTCTAPQKMLVRRTQSLALAHNHKRRATVCRPALTWHASTRREISPLCTHLPFGRISRARQWGSPQQDGSLQAEAAQASTTSSATNLRGCLSELPDIIARATHHAAITAATRRSRTVYASLQFGRYYHHRSLLLLTGCWLVRVTGRRQAVLRLCKRKACR